MRTRSYGRGVPDSPGRRALSAALGGPERPGLSVSASTWPRRRALVEGIRRAAGGDRRGVRRAWAASGCTSGRWSTGAGGRPGTTGRCGSAARGTDEVVESHRITCSHFDAFRFFTDSARPLNTLPPGRDDRPQFEQPGCLHAGMDLYKHAFRLTPLVASELVADCFELAWDIRDLDMRASPYDLSELGFDAGAHRDAGGQAGVRRRPAGLRRAGAPLRQRLVEECDRLLALDAHAARGRWAHRRGRSKRCRMLRGGRAAAIVTEVDAAGRV